MKANERVFTNVTEQRRKTMSKIRGKDTKIEETLRKALWARGYRYRKNYKMIPGSPDICFTKYKREWQVSIRPCEINNFARILNL